MRAQERKLLDVCGSFAGTEIDITGGITMKKKFKLQDLDCANCAQKMEDAIKKIEGVDDASVNFMMQKMTIEAAEEKFDEIMKKVVDTCKKVEPDCVILM